MNWGVIAAGAIVIALPVIFFGIAIRKYYVKGLTQGGLQAIDEGKTLPNKRQSPWTWSELFAALAFIVLVRCL